MAGFAFARRSYRPDGCGAIQIPFG